jgi:non-ribosomal peptide synthetase component E (peptide arylation enzyme)
MSISARRPTLYALISAQAERNPSAVAIVAPQRKSLSYGGLRQQVKKTGSRLNDPEIGHGDCVAIVPPHGPMGSNRF